MKPPFLEEGSIRLDRLFQAYRNNPALMIPAGMKSFAEVENKLRAVVAGLAQAGVRKGHCIALHKANSELHLYLFLASWIMDFLYLPLDFKAPPEGLLADTDIDVLVTDQPMPTHTGCEVLSPSKVLSAGNKDFRENIPWQAIPLQQEASAIFTSGSTGKPRGIVHTVGNYVYSALGTNEFIGIDSSDRWLLSLPLFHVGGALIWIRTLLAGCACILPQSLQSLENAVRHYRPTVVSLVPAQLIRLLENEEMVPLLKNMKTLMLGGAPSPGWLIDKSLDLKLPIMPTYGCTESCAQITGVAQNSTRAAYFTAGRIVPYRSIRIEDDGIVRIGGKTVFNRYLHEPDGNPLDSDGFFKTADSGTIDDEGNLIIGGRTDGVFISGGENISPQEIENALLKLDGMVTAIVVPVPHREYGLTPWAFVETSDSFDEKRILDRLRKALPGYKLPKKIIRLTPDDRQGKMKYSRETLIHLARSLSEGKPQTQLHYEEAGPSDAQVIVFLHGFMGKARSWKKITDQLSDRFRSIAFDLPGHGSSLFCTHDHLKQLQDMEDTARLILRDLDTLGVQHFTLYGYSMGGRIAQHMAIAAPERIKHLILESASFGMEDIRERRERFKKDQSLFGNITSPADFRIFLEQWYKMPLFLTLQGTARLQTLIEDKVCHPVDEFQQALNLLSVGGHDFLVPKLAACRIPVHYFCGEKDDAYRQTAERVRMHLPGMTVKIFPDASHNISIQHPQEIARAIFKILI